MPGKTVKSFTFLILILVTLFTTPSINYANEAKKGEKKYGELSKIARSGKSIPLFFKLNNTPRKLDWSKSTPIEFDGNLRILSVKNSEINDKTTLYLIRKLSGEILNLSVPLAENPFYKNLEKMSENKLSFKIKTLKDTIDGKEYTFARFEAQPIQPLFDRIFKISIVLMLFLVMVGMGMTLTIKEFVLVFKNPMGIIIGEVLQFGIIPLLAVLLAYLGGFYSEYPYIYVGFILIAVSPGGVVSNLMTHYAKGDLALSISITSFSTVLSLFFTPFLLALYCSNVPEISIPVKMIALTVTVLVLLPLIIGMVIKSIWSDFADRATPFFSKLGMISLAFILIAGVISNLDKFADFERYSLKLYSTVFLLTISGMVLGGLVPKIFKLNNYQARAISLETGLRNSTLAMTLALLIQDKMGDFYSSMFAVSGIFGLLMFIAGIISIFSFDKVLPVKKYK